MFCLPRTAGETAAYRAWNDFFNHSFWENISTAVNESYAVANQLRSSAIIPYIDTEEDIEDHVSAINDRYNVQVDVKVEANGIHQQFLNEFLRKFPAFRNMIPRGLHIDFYAKTDAPQPYSIWWKVRNVGEYAERNNKIRGQIIKNSGNHRREDSQFAGPHFVECYVIKNNECVALTRVHVNIGDSSV